jgi:hypothetical protein
VYDGSVAVIVTSETFEVFVSVCILYVCILYLRTSFNPGLSESLKVVIQMCL